MIAQLMVVQMEVRLSARTIFEEFANSFYLCFRFPVVLGTHKLPFTPGEVYGKQFYDGKEDTRHSALPLDRIPNHVAFTLPAGWAAIFDMCVARTPEIQSNHIRISFECLGDAVLYASVLWLDLHGILGWLTRAHMIVKT